MAPAEMESLVTFPIESAINGASGVRRVRSATAIGLAVVWVEFEWGQDILRARQIVTEKLAVTSGTLPPEVETPFLAPISHRLALGLENFEFLCNRLLPENLLFCVCTKEI